MLIVDFHTNFLYGDKKKEHKNKYRAFRCLCYQNMYYAQNLVTFAKHDATLIEISVPRRNVYCRAITRQNVIETKKKSSSRPKSALVFLMASFDITIQYFHIIFSFLVFYNLYVIYDDIYDSRAHTCSQMILLLNISNRI